MLWPPSTPAHPKSYLHACARQVADVITELKLGNGTSVLIFANIASALPSSVGGALSQVPPAAVISLCRYYC